MANSAAILTDAFPSNQRGLALGINNIAAISGSFIGLILDGVLGAIDWRLVFLVSVPFGLFGTIWSYLKLKGPARRLPDQGRQDQRCGRHRHCRRQPTVSSHDSVGKLTASPTANG